MHFFPLEGVGGKKKVPCFFVILEFWRKPRLFLLNVWMLYCFISWKGPSLIDPAFLRERYFLAFRSLLTTQQNQTLRQQNIPFSFYLGKNYQHLYSLYEEFFLIVLHSHFGTFFSYLISPSVNQSLCMYVLFNIRERHQLWLTKVNAENAWDKTKTRNNVTLIAEL